MTMSVHLVRHRVRDLPGLWRTRSRLVAGIERIPGVAVAHLSPDIALHAATGGTPRPRSTVLLVGWQDREARDACLAGAGPLAPYMSDAVESWSMALDAVRVLRGDWHGWRPDAEGVERLAPEEPVVSLTFAVTPARAVPAFFQGNRRVCRELDGNAAEALRFGFIDGPLGFGTVSLWRSVSEMTRFAYRAPAHEPVRRRFEEKGHLHSQFFTRFRPVASWGSWQGGDPLAELRAAPGRDVDTADALRARR